MIHKSYIEGYSFPELAEEIGNLRYDALNLFLEQLARKLQKDSQADAKRGRKQLAQALQQTAQKLDEARSAVREAWRICQPFMDS